MIHDYIHFIKRSWPLLVFGMITVFWGNFGQSFFISWYGASFQESLQLTATAYGSAYSTATLGSGLLLMWIGAAIDRISLRWFVIFSATGLLIATISLSQTSTLTGLVICLFMLRLFGQGLLPHTGLTTMAKEFSFNRGKAVSIASTGVPLGEILLPSFALALIAAFGWQKSWLIVGLTIPFIYLPCALWLLNRSHQIQYKEQQPATTPEVNRSPKRQGSRRTLLKDYRFWFSLPAILAAPFIITGIFIHQGFILPEMGWTPLLFASCFVFYGVSHWFSSMYIGALVDRFSGVQLFKFYPIPMLLGLFVCSIASGHWVAYTLMLLLGLSIGSANPIINGLWAEVYGTKHLGAIRALISSLAVISTAASPILFGILIDRGISAQGLFGLLTLCVVGAVLLSLLSFSARRVLGENVTKK
ncbi:MAG: MFS family permease [Desulforhopalus sp.]|jgi:MFS family permease